jgi:putative oxidoreductase
MSDTEIFAKWRSWAPEILSITRIVAAAIFITSGTMKLFAFPMGMPPDGGTAPLMSQAGIGGLLEVVGGLLVLIGLFTRPTAFILSGEMAVAYFQFHAPGSFWPTINQGTTAILYCFLFLYLSAAGPGPWSADAVRRRT